MFLVVNLDTRPDRWETMQRLLPGAIRFQATAGSIPDTYHRLQEQAIAEGWGLDTVVVQDDQQFVGPLEKRPIMRGSKVGRRGEPQIIVYGTLRRHGHICPKAFAATGQGWELLEVWDGTMGPGKDGRGIICEQFRPVIEEYGAVLNITREVAVGRNAPCANCP